MGLLLLKRLFLDWNLNKYKSILFILVQYPINLSFTLTFLKKKEKLPNNNAPTVGYTEQDNVHHALHTMSLTNKNRWLAQYSRPGCLELVGVPRSVSVGGLQKQVLKIFEKVGRLIEGSNMEACNQLNAKNDRVAVKFFLEFFLRKCTLCQKKFEKYGYAELSWRTILHLLSDVYVLTVTCGQNLSVFLTRIELGSTPKMKISKNSLPLARAVNDC